jgi:hypothetical protein
VIETCQLTHRNSNIRFECRTTSVGPEPCFGVWYLGVSKSIYIPTPQAALSMFKTSPMLSERAKEDAS